MLQITRSKGTRWKVPEAKKSTNHSPFFTSNSPGDQLWSFALLPTQQDQPLGATGWQHAVQQKHYKMNYQDLSRVDLSTRKKGLICPKASLNLGAKVRWKPWWKRGAPRSKPLSGLPSGPLPREKIYARLLQARNGNQSLDQAIASELWRNLTD